MAKPRREADSAESLGVCITCGVTWSVNRLVRESHTLAYQPREKRLTSTVYVSTTSTTSSFIRCTSLSFSLYIRRGLLSSGTDAEPDGREYLTTRSSHPALFDSSVLLSECFHSSFSFCLFPTVLHSSTCLLGSILVFPFPIHSGALILFHFISASSDAERIIVGKSGRRQAVETDTHYIGVQRSAHSPIMNGSYIVPVCM